HESKVRAAESILSLMPKALNRVFFASSGSESVETALKTARLMTGRSRVIYFEGAYHGLGYGALQVTDRNHFRKPFLDDAGRTGIRLPFMECGSDSRLIKKSIADIQKILKKKNSASAVILELIQGRGGVRRADPEWVKQLRKVTKQNKAVLIIDEIYTGFGRTGSHFAFQKFGIVPDLLCLGKAMSNGFPISACVMSRAAESAWGKSSGEAKHTSTFLGNPLGCEMIAEVIRQMNQPGTVRHFQRQSAYMLKALEKLHSAAPKEIAAINGEGMMFGIVFRKKYKAVLVSKKLLSTGVITLPCGTHSNVLALSPSFFITENEINYLISSILRII
ncbi:MAG: aspartate aminotransferase family protein, partial [Candidatus Omnitrophica bacterium]|nr:aspartate aminotransferase family protein [Candidatus Omnitrophota bacterium]